MAKRIKKMHIEMVRDIIKALELIDIALPELQESFEYQQLNCYRVEGINIITQNRFTKAQLKELSDRLAKKVMEAYNKL